MNSITSCALVFVLVISFLTVTAITEDSVYDNIWKDVRSWFRSFTDIERKCQENGMPFNSTKLENELELCLRPSLKEFLNSVMSMGGQGRQNHQLGFILHEINSGRPVEAEHINLLRQGIVEPFCRFAPSFFSCVEPPQKELIEVCTTNGGYATILQGYVKLFSKSVCKNNGTLLVDFVVSEGMACGESFMQNASECFQHFSSDGFPRTQQTVQERCDNIGKLHDCATLALNTCPKKKPVNILQPMLADLKAWISTECHVNINTSSTGKQVLDLNTGLTLFISMFYLLSLE